MNAGAHGSDMSEILVKAHILFEDGTIEWLTNEQMDFSYRTSVLQRNARAFALKLFCSWSRRIRNQSFSECKAIKTIEKIHSRIQVLVREAYSEIRFPIMPGTL